jgi:hypothetical protein
MKKVMEILKKIITGIFAVIFFAFVIAMTILLLTRNEFGVTQIDKTSMIIIRDEISSDNYTKGDIVLVKEYKIDKLEIGDEVFVYQVDSDGSATVDLGFIGEIHDVDDNTDDAIVFENGATYSIEFVIGKTDQVYPKVGNYLSIINSRWGFLFIILIPSFLIFIYSLYTLIIEVKYGRDELPD